MRWNDIAHKNNSKHDISNNDISNEDIGIEELVTINLNDNNKVMKLEAVSRY